MTADSLLLFKSAACMPRIMMKNNLCIKAFFIQAGPGGVRWGQVGACGGEILSKKKSSRDLYNVFFCTYDSNSLISNRQCLHLNNLLLSLIPPLLLLCLHWSHCFLRCLLRLIERRKKVESRALKVLKEGEFLMRFISPLLKWWRGYIVHFEALHTVKRLFESLTKQKVGCVVCVKRREELSHILLN